MSDRLRVLLLIPHLGGGGAEQVTALLARGLSDRKYEIHLGLVTQESWPPGAMPDTVTVHSLGASRGKARRTSNSQAGPPPKARHSCVRHVPPELCRTNAATALPRANSSDRPTETQPSPPRSRPTCCLGTTACSIDCFTDLPTGLCANRGQWPTT